MGRHTRIRRILVLAACTAGLAACGGGGSAKVAATTTTAPAAATTTTTIPHASVDVRPASGPVGTSFQLLATRFQPGEIVLFEIGFPSGTTFKGTVKHKATADGSVIDATYRVTTGNPTGTYQVKATGDKGTQATGQFEVAAGAAGASTTLAGHSSTTLRTGTTLHTATTLHTTTTR